MWRKLLFCPELLECQVCEEKYEAKVEIENCVMNVHETQIRGNILKIEEKVCKKLAEKIYELFRVKDKKIVDNKNEEGFFLNYEID